MDNKEIFEQIEKLSTEQIVGYIIDGYVSVDDIQKAHISQYRKNDILSTYHKVLEIRRRMSVEKKNKEKVAELDIQISVGFLNNNLPCKLISKNKKYGLEDEKGKLLIPIEFEELKLYSSIIVLRYHGRCGCWNSEKKILDYKYNDIIFYEQIKCLIVSENIEIGYKKECVWGVYDIEGNEILGFKYSSVSIANDLLVASKEHGQHVYFKYLNNKLTALYQSERDIWYNNQDYFIVRDCNKHYGVLDENAQIVVPIVYDKIEYQNNELIVFKDGLCGIIEASGKTSSPIIYESLGILAHGIRCAKKNSKWGYIDKYGKELIPFGYDEAYCFYGLHALVKKGDTARIIDKNGCTIKVFPCIEILEYSEFGAYVIINHQRKEGVVDVLTGTWTQCLYSEIHPYHRDFTTNKLICKVFQDNIRHKLFAREPYREAVDVAVISGICNEEQEQMPNVPYNESGKNHSSWCKPIDMFGHESHQSTEGLWSKFKNALFGTKNQQEEKSSSISYEPDVPQTNALQNNSNSSSDNVDHVVCSVFAPTNIKVRKRLMVQVYFHLPELLDKVIKQAQEADSKAERRKYKALSQKIRRGANIDVELVVENEEEVYRESQHLIWQPPFVECTFKYKVPKDLPEDELLCDVHVVVDGIVVGRLSFLTAITDVTTQTNAEVLAIPTQCVFISYAHKDTEQVQFLAEGYRALDNLEYFFDRHKLKPGDEFESKIFESIDKSDLFILCWSKNAAESEWVTKERLYAFKKYIESKKENSRRIRIYPVSMKPSADLPTDMGDILNFGQLI